MMIDKTKELVEEKFTIANGYAHDAKVLILIIFCRNIFEIENNIHGRVEIWNLTRSLTRISHHSRGYLTRISHEDISRLRRSLTRISHDSRGYLTRISHDSQGVSRGYLTRISHDSRGYLARVSHDSRGYLTRIYLTIEQSRTSEISCSASEVNFIFSSIRHCSV